VVFGTLLIVQRLQLSLTWGALVSPSIFKGIKGAAGDKEAEETRRRRRRRRQVNGKQVQGEQMARVHHCFGVGLYR
jgi:hypothetical protein